MLKVYSPPEEESNLATILIAVFVTLAAVIIIAIVVTVIYQKCCMRRPAPSVKVRKPRKQLSVTDYMSGTPRKAAKTEGEGGQILKKTTAELITDLGQSKANSIQSLVMDAYEPPKKQTWQKKWESSSRIERENRLNYNSDPKLPINMFDPDKALTMSTSLPESLDNPPGRSRQSSPPQNHRPIRESGRANSENIVSTRGLVTPRTRATPKIPESTGKFGSRPVSTEPILVPIIDQPPKQLDTISENHISREASCVHNSDGTKHGPQQAQTSGVPRRLVEIPNLMSARSRDRMSSAASGWRYKWETVMRPAVIKLRQTFARSITPVRLFQDIILEERSDTKQNVPTPEDISAVFNVDIQSMNASVHDDIPGTIDKSESTSVVLVSETNKIPGFSGKCLSIASTDVLNDSIVTDSNTTCVNEKGQDELNSNVKISHLELELEDDDVALSLESLNRHILNLMCDVENETRNAEQADDTESIVSSKSDRPSTPEDHFDSVSINPELFYPETWLYGDSFDMNTDNIWRECNKVFALKRRREIRMYMGLHLAPVSSRPARVVKTYKRQRSKTRHKLN